MKYKIGQEVVIDRIAAGRVTGSVDHIDRRFPNPVIRVKCRVVGGIEEYYFRIMRKDDDRPVEVRLHSQASFVAVNSQVAARIVQ